MRLRVCAFLDSASTGTSEWTFSFFFFRYSPGSNALALSFVVPLPLSRSIIHGLVCRVNITDGPIRGVTDVRENPLAFPADTSDVLIA